MRGRGREQSRPLRVRRMPGTMAARKDRPTTDEGMLERHTRGTPMGVVRPVSLDEDLAPDTFFRPDAVLTLTGPAPADLGPFEAHIASLIDGARPVARLRKKSGVSSADLRIALGALRDRNLLRVSGIVVEAVGEVAADIARDLAEQKQTIDDATSVPRGRPDIVPPHVMAEIRSMLDEDPEE